MSLIKDEYNVKLSDDEMYLILDLLEKKIERLKPDGDATKYQALWDRLTDIYEDRV